MTTAITDERLKAHRAESRKEARRRPRSYMVGYPNILIDEDNKVVVMTRADVRRLDEYSASVPTGVYVDKCWLFQRPEAAGRFDEDVKLWLRVYREDSPPSTEMLIVSYEILLAD